jgi:hypothetical protein
MFNKNVIPKFEISKKSKGFSSMSENDCLDALLKLCPLYAIYS